MQSFKEYIAESSDKAFLGKAGKNVDLTNLTVEKADVKNLPGPGPTGMMEKVVLMLRTTDGKLVTVFTTSDSGYEAARQLQLHPKAVIKMHIVGVVKKHNEFQDIKSTIVKCSSLEIVK